MTPPAARCRPSLSLRSRGDGPTGRHGGGPGSRASVGGVLGHATAAVATATDVFGGAARALLTPRGLAGAAIEYGWLSLHAAFYPLGLLSGREEHHGHGFSIEKLPPVQRGLLIGDVEAAGTPILLVHGMVDNRSIFTLLRLGLRRRGFGRVLSINYSPLTADVRAAAELLAEEVEALVAETGYERIHVVGHSLGGLIARYYVQRLGGDERVHTLVTLGTPHAGTWNAYALPTRLGRQLRPGSRLMRELAEPAPQCRTRFVAYSSDLDQLVFPQRNARIDHPELSVRNVGLHGVGHMSLPILGSVVHGISTALAHLDPDGSTQTAGVTDLASRTPAPGRSRGDTPPPGRVSQ